MRSYPWAAWRGAIVTAFIIAGLIVVSELNPNPVPLPWAHPPEFVAIVAMVIAPIVVFFALSQER